MKINKSIEVIIGILTLLGAIYLIGSFSKKYFFYRPSDLNSYSYYHAYFVDIDGLNIGTEVKIAGVNVGKIIGYSFTNDYQIDLRFSLLDKYKISSDSMAMVATSGILGGRYLKIIPGTNEEMLKEGEEIAFTQSALNIENLVSFLKK